MALRYADVQLHMGMTRQAPQPPPAASERRRCLLSCSQEVVKAPRKALYRMRAHSNPLNDASFPVPISPDAYDWCGRRRPRQAARLLAAQTLLARCLAGQTPRTAMLTHVAFN